MLARQRSRCLLALLGPDLGRLVAVSTLADDAHYSNIAGRMPPTLKGRCGGELESLLALRPDLAVLATFSRPELLAHLNAAGVHTFVLSAFTNLDDIEHHIDTLGHLTHTEGAARALLDDFRHTRAELAKAVAASRAPRPSVLEFFPAAPVSGAATLFDDLVRSAGGRNLAAEQGFKGWPQISAETLASLRPDLIVAGGEAADRDSVLRTMRAAPGWKEMPAVREGRLVLIPDRQLAATSPHILQALAQLHAAFVRQPPGRGP